MSNQTLTLPDGRQLGYAVEGEGNPVVHFHGTASSRLEILLLRHFSRTNNIRLVGIDRPGYGLSTFKDRFNLRDFAPDVNAIADHLNIDNFAVLSWSGGGPFALAYTALSFQRVTHAVVVACPSLPFDPATAHNNNPLAKFAMKAPFLAKWGLTQFRRAVLNANQDIDAYLQSSDGKKMVADWPEPDARFFADAAWLKLMYGAMAEGFRQDSNSVKTIYQEHRLFMNPWSEPINQIPKGKVTLWQGSQDKTCPPTNAQKVAQVLKDAQVNYFADEGHCVMFAKTGELSKALSS